MAAAPQAFPVHVTKNAEGDFLLTLPEHHPAVLTTRSFVLWIVEDGSASIHMHLAILLFSSRCIFSAVPSHQAFFKGVSVLTFNLTEGAWCKVLSMLGTAGVFNEPDLSRKSYIKTMMAADIAVERTTILPADLAACDPFDEPERGGRGGRGGRGSSSIATQPATPGPEQLRLLQLCSVLDLVATRGQPLSLLARLAGMLGPCLTHARRRDEGSMVRVVSQLLVTNIGFFLGAGSVPYEHPVLAASLKAFLEATELPLLLQGDDTSPSSLAVDASDGMR